MYELDPATFQVHWQEDTSKIYEIQFFVQGSDYKILGLIPSNLHLFGVEEGGTVYPDYAVVLKKATIKTWPID